MVQPSLTDSRPRRVSNVQRSLHSGSEDNCFAETLVALLLQICQCCRRGFFLEFCISSSPVALASMKLLTETTIRYSLEIQTPRSRKTIGPLHYRHQVLLSLLRLRALRWLSLPRPNLIRRHIHLRQKELVCFEIEGGDQRYERLAVDNGGICAQPVCIFTSLWIA